MFLKESIYISEYAAFQLPQNKGKMRRGETIPTLPVVFPAQNGVSSRGLQQQTCEAHRKLLGSNKTVLH
jgi:hypothetical protein